MKSGHAPSCNLNNLFKASLGCDCTGDFRAPPLDKPGVFANLKAPEPPKLVDFTGANIRDLPARLRTLADSIEMDMASAGGDVTSICLVLIKDGKPDVRAFGVSHDRFHAAGILQAGIKDLLA